MQTFFGSVKKCSASLPPSRPSPDCLAPPQGVRKSRNNQQLIQTMPYSRRAASRCARDRSRVPELKRCARRMHRTPTYAFQLSERVRPPSTAMLTPLT
jgi:hypothetical protein